MCTAANPSGIRAAESSPYIVKEDKAFLYQRFQSMVAVMISSLSRCALKHFITVIGCECVSSVPVHFAFRLNRYNV